MAKKSKIAKDAQRREIVARYADRRAELKRTILSPQSSPEEVSDAVKALAKLPRDSSPTRLRNRDVVDGRPRSVYRKFGLSRVRLREEAHAGNLPGVTKSSW
ncbi:30S ribosomal protein S14 [Dermatophilus congolensis]|uniref:Small ribosomal subunit protein uS14 n=1 Tax=Dermatophilus congolensis TaxID=1863 RepID=A0A239VSM9_9MICO|nr:30S ribosomal protein S14 [Dermatophilus congolensis]MBO3129808.1 30S ribosomal protein S14 [Dermatophilus congolensis]MBO3131563.1 30S ribosomal protein S14 [Dermatophilus congolensis]MBO3134284.1 30S ribosomal protein S14 [Dermatophilus congolensis]MBO3136517.1 30S ribosomal protein S14 [Dermatophilus congolensis]MBO3138762.1 30S ribosomal protein S14 [Dermatophilus congolensis]